jgi:hypothetical protein
MAALYYKIASHIKVDQRLIDFQREAQSKIVEKTSLFPSFSLISIHTGYHGDDFVNNKLTVVMEFKQENTN